MTTTRPPEGRAGRAEDRPDRPVRPADTSPAHESGRGPAAVVAVKRLFRAETPEYFWVLGTTIFMVVFGLVMVLSSSSIESHRESENFFARFSRQGMFALIGVPVMLIAARLPITFWKRWGWRFLIGAMGLQLLVFVPGLGWGTGGNHNWIRIAGFSMQPSEFVKFALVIWLAVILTSKANLLHDWRHVALPIAPVGGLAIGLVLLGRDLGTATIMLSIVLGALFFGNVRLRILGAAAVGVTLVAGVFLMTSEGNRRDRLQAWMTGCTQQEDYADFCWQTVHGWWALASGGPFGVGLGNSTAKWSWLPAADNDFIFAIIGEELGMAGAILVLLLFVLLAIGFVRIARAARDPFVKIVTATVMVWVVGQAFVNIAVVLGLLPVLGVPLPLISAGGSALVTTMAAIGVVLSFARTRPGTAPGGFDAGGDSLAGREFQAR